MRNYVLPIVLCVFLLPTALMAQEGPGGVDGSTNIQYWLPVDRLTGETNGANITTWTDFSGNGNDVAGAFNTRPTYVTNQINSLPALTFNGTSQAIFDGTNTALNTQTVSWIVVGQSNNNTTTQVFVRSRYITGITSHQFLWSTYVSSAGTVRVDSKSATGSDIIVNSTFSTGYNIYGAIWNGATGNLSGFKNGSFSGSATGANANPTGHAQLVFGRQSTNGSNRLNGGMAEVIVLTKVINSAERTIMENYLSSKYNIAISNDRFAHDAGHGTEVFGIGGEADGTNADAQGTGIVRINSASSLGTADYLLVGHDDASTGSQTGDVPAIVTTNSGSRMTRVWRVDETGDVGTVSISFDLSGISFAINPDNYALLIANSASGGTMSGGAMHTTGHNFNVGTSVLSFTGVDFADGDFFTLVDTNNVDTIRSNVAVGNWETPGSWDCTCEPSEFDAVIIQNGHDITVTTGTAEAASLEVESTGTLTMSGSSTLSLKEDLDLQGTYVTGSGEMVFDGTVPQKISNNSGGAMTVFDLTINNSAGVSLDAGPLTLENTMTLTDGPFNNGNTFTFSSTVSRQAHIRGTTSGSLTGTYNVDRFVTSRDAFWGDIASPVAGSTIASYDDDIFMSNVGGNNGNACCPLFTSVYKYDETAGSYTAINSTAVTVNPGEGLELWLASDTVTLAAFTFSVTGSINTASTDLGVTRNNTGWNLVGNPFPGFVSWSAISADAGSFSNLQDNFFVFDANAGNFGTYGDGNLIPPSQGFWVFSSSGTPNMDVTMDHLVAQSNNTTFLKRGESLLRPNELKLKLTSDENSYYHESYVRFNSSSSINYDDKDIPFLPSRVEEAPNITALTSDDQKLVISSVSDVEDNIVLPLAVEVGVPGTYTITASELDNVYSYECVTLEDAENGEFIDLSEWGSYTFEFDPADNKDRFKLHMSRDGSELCEQPNGEVNILNTENGVFVDYSLTETTSSTISVYNLLGQKAAADINLRIANGRKQINLPVSKGLYILVVDTDGQRVSKKVNL